ncbi:DUF72 domain-containing protein [Lacticaseibacillus mingshuiensis]|uniref:DUF72 domain-containing protein n=1 Tax=Lacticaseibacillus mingshuiensis TaxID=2799574 RepID=UPI00194F7760|nr:DUF72 domain-containing protein [Lacticaseibacillus mingshuiensis]
MILVGLTAVAEHPDLAPNGKASTLSDIATVFPVVEMDTTFYHIPGEKTVRNWQRQVPPTFQFIVKATATMTQHEPLPADTDRREPFIQLRASLQSLIDAKQLTAILFQLPPWFGATADNIAYLKWVRTQYPDLPIAIELRDGSWLSPKFRNSTLALWRQLDFINVVVDEPQVPGNPVPLVPEVTNPTCAIMRLHGRNLMGWLKQGAAWRGERTNYRYSDDELTVLGKTAMKLAAGAKQVFVIFNNNGHQDASPDAQRFIAQQGLQFTGLAPRQLDLF